MVTFSLGKSVPKSATAVDVPITVEQCKKLPAARKKLCSVNGFTGKVGQTLVLQSEGVATEVLVGLGPVKELTTGTIRRSAAAYSRSVKHHTSVATTMFEVCSATGAMETADVLAATVEGLALPTYRFLSDADSGSSLQRVSVQGQGAGLKAELTRTLAILDSVFLARDLGNEPGGTLTPVEFATRAKKLGTEAGLQVTVWAEKKIEREKLGGLLAVNQGSEEPPRFLKLTYKPKSKSKANVALVGKGITFDSGGLSLKTSAGMMTMKIDMAGGAAVLAAMLALPVVKPSVTVTGYIPLTDNMTGGLAQRPGDVFTARNGKTVEVLNTDAEGRLVLADALSLAAEAKPDAIIDIATLTGASTMALGKAYVALMATDDELSERIEKSAATTGEKIWRLPLPEEYASQLDSTVADVKNISGERSGGAITAGLFLKHFVSDVPWAHLDLGMSAMVDSDSGLNAKGATGTGVRLLVDLLRAWE